jgi:GNAT superfamily N-acetyltransferase
VAGLLIRNVRVDDALSLAGALREWGADYAAIDPQAFRVPDEEGLVEWFEEQLRDERDDDDLWLIAERERQLVGYIQAQVWRPSPDARRQIMRDASETLLKIDALMVTATARRDGVGTALMEAAEAWGHTRGATQAIVISSAHSPTSVPFYEERMGYARTTIGFSKRLSPPPRRSS